MVLNILFFLFISVGAFAESSLPGSVCNLLYPSRSLPPPLPEIRSLNDYLDLMEHIHETELEKLVSTLGLPAALAIQKLRDPSLNLNLEADLIYTSIQSYKHIFLNGKISAHDLAVVLVLIYRGYPSSTTLQYIETGLTENIRPETARGIHENLLKIIWPWNYIRSTENPN